MNLKRGPLTSKGVYQVGEESVAVPWGTFQAVTLRGESYEGDSRTATFTYWFAPGVGIVKQVLRAGSKRTVMELEEFESPK